MTSRKPSRPQSRPARRKALTQPGARLSDDSSAQQVNDPAGRAPSQPAWAVIVQATDDDRFALLATALAQSDFWAHLDAARRRHEAELQHFQIIIKPDFALFDQGASTGTNPALVEQLIDLLHQHNYSHVLVGAARDSFDLWLENRDVVLLADLAGYGFVTQQGHSYDVIELGEDLVDVSFPEGSALYGSRLARAWMEAGYRISFAKNKTDEEHFYALGLQNLLGVLPLRDKDYHYHQRLKPWDVGVDLLRAAPVDFSLIDAFVSNHGSAGAREAHPIITRTLIASQDLLLADWAAALKMGLDPYASPINANALRVIGLPAGYKIDGDLAPYRDWINVHPLLADSVHRRNRWLGLSRMIKPWLQSVNQELFPFKDPINGRLNALVARYLANPDDNPVAFWALIGLNYALGLIHEGAEGLQTIYDKDRLRWQAAPLDLDLSAYDLADYEAVVDYLQPLAQLIRESPADSNGLRWRYLDGSVLFEFSRVIPAPYDDFVAQVDISKAIQFMNDYIGGVAVPVTSNQQGRVTHQAERNLYLPQPNYIALYQGKTIDVTKLEYIQYGAQEQTIFWRTIKSENGSAEFDDGIVTFARTTGDETLVSVVGRQLFTLPSFWQVVDLDLNPQVKSYLVTHAYTTFFTHTLANFEAIYEGREIRIGRPWKLDEGELGVATSEKAATEWIADMLAKVTEIVNQHLENIRDGRPWLGKPSGPAPSYVDQEGFVHFKVAGANSDHQASAQPAGDQGMLDEFLAKVGVEVRAYWTDIAAAMQKDWGIRQGDTRV